MFGLFLDITNQKWGYLPAKERGFDKQSNIWISTIKQNGLNRLANGLQGRWLKLGHRGWELFNQEQSHFFLLSKTVIQEYPYYSE